MTTRMLVEEPSDAAKLAGYARTRVYIRSRLLEASRQVVEVESMIRRAETRNARAEINADSMKYRTRVNFWKHLLDMLEPPPEVATGIFPGAGRRAIDGRGKKGGRK